MAFSSSSLRRSSAAFFLSIVTSLRLEGHQQRGKVALKRTHLVISACFSSFSSNSTFLTACAIFVFCILSSKLLDFQPEDWRVRLLKELKPFLHSSLDVVGRTLWAFVAVSMFSRIHARWKSSRGEAPVLQWKPWQTERQWAEAENAIDCTLDDRNSDRTGNSHNGHTIHICHCGFVWICLTLPGISTTQTPCD